MTSTDPFAKKASATAARWLLNLAAVLVLLGAAAMLVPGLLGYERYVITGGSMSGTFERGSLVFERPVPVSQLRVGDIITYQPPVDSGLTDLVTHRIHTLEQTEAGTVLRTKGDANPQPDPWTFQLDATTQPTVEVVVPHVGTVFMFLGDRSNRMLVIGVPAGLVALYSLRELALGLRRPRPRPAGA